MSIYFTRIVNHTFVSNPPNYPETADFHFAFAEILTKLIQSANASSSSSSSSTSLIIKRYTKERAEALQRCYAIRKIAFGAEHSRTRSTLKLMQSFLIAPSPSS
jgi:hypothetical protein